MNQLTIDPKTADLDAMIKRGTLLHGHLGPFLVAGIRMGLLALDLLGEDGYFGLRAETEAGSVTPLSCLNDGVQIGSGCTAGKGNLIVHDGGRPRVRFTSDAGRTVTIEVRSEAMADFRVGDIEGASERTKLRPLEELFEWNESSS